MCIHTYMYVAHLAHGATNTYICLAHLLSDRVQLLHEGLVQPEVRLDHHGRAAHHELHRRHHTPVPPLDAVRRDVPGRAEDRAPTHLASTYLACSVCMYVPTGALDGAECAVLRQAGTVCTYMPLRAAQSRYVLDSRRTSFS